MDGSLLIGTHTLDLVRGRVDGPGASCSLTPLEALFLAYLARRMDTVVPKEDLLREVWGYAKNVRSRAVDATLIRVRSKLEGTGIAIEAVWGRGLQLTVDEPPPAPQEPVARERSALIGRDALLEQLASLTARPGVVSVWGPPGVGKTALVRALDDVWVLAGEGDRSIEQELCSRLGCTASEIPTALGRIRARIAIDDAESRSAGELELARSWGEHAAVVLIGTRRHPARAEPGGPGSAAELRVEPLDSGAATQLLARRSGLPTSTCAPLVGQTDCLPRQIELLAQAIGFVGAEAVAELGSGVFPAMESAVEVLWGELDASQRAVLGAVSIFHDRFDLIAAARVSDSTPHAVLPVLQGLYERSLVQGDHGVFRLLAPVRAVATRYRDPGVESRFHAYCGWLLEDNARGGPRWHRHVDDLLGVLRVTEGALAAEVGVMCAEAAVYPGGPDLGAHHGPERRPLVLALMVLTYAFNKRDDEARRLLPLIEAPLDDPSSELVRRAARLRWDPEPLPLDPLGPHVSVALYAATFSLAAAGGWMPSGEACVQLATLGERAGYPAVALAMYSFASAVARRAGDPAWIDLGRRGGQECRFTVELRRDDPAAAARVAAASFEVERNHLVRVELAGMQAVALLLDGRRDEAEAVVDRYAPRAGFYLQLANVVLGRIPEIDNPIRQQWVDLARRGELEEPGHTTGDVGFVFARVLTRLPVP
ncbi:MAG: winged helix-turn-helix domain-containing protein [Myxococcota bacterium]